MSGTCASVLASSGSRFTHCRFRAHLTKESLTACPPDLPHTVQTLLVLGVLHTTISLFFIFRSHEAHVAITNAERQLR